MGWRRRRKKLKLRTSSKTPGTRAEATKVLKLAATDWLVKLGYGVHHEVGVKAFGARKVDLLATNLRGNIIVVEVKSCIADLRADKKFHEYAEFCSQLFLCVLERVWRKHKAYIKKRAYEARAGVLVLIEPPDSLGGYARVLFRSGKRDLEKATAFAILSRMAWRGAKFSRRTQPRRTRRFLKEE